MQKLSVAVLGASGFSGLELLRLLARHPRVELKVAASDRWAGKPVQHHPSLSFLPPAEALAAAKKTQLSLLATPNEASMDFAPELLDAGVRVVDLSGAFRLRDASLYPKFYGFTHRHAQHLSSSAYGLPELGFRGRVKQTKLVANPGCYATAVALQLAPLVERALVDTSNVVVNAASGVSGAGRKATEDFSYMEIADDFRAYRVLKHQHLPEIEQTLRQVMPGSQPRRRITGEMPGLNDQLARKFGVPSVDLEALQIDADLLKHVPRELALQHRVIPISRNGDQLVIAMANPADAVAARAVLKASGFTRFETVAAQEPQVLEAILRSYPHDALGLVFTPHLLPIKRGILSTAVVTLKPDVTAAEVQSAFEDAYRGEALVTVQPNAEAVRIANVVHTPRAEVGVSVEGNKAVVISALDNLLKGAASQAMQNLNLMFGFDETEGLLS